MAKCPLCNNTRHITINTFKMDALRLHWRDNFGFDPFEGYKVSDTLLKLKCAECGLIHFNPPFYGDKTFYEALSKNAWYYELDKWEFNEVINLILNYHPKSILEIGCGAGCFLEKIVNFTERAEGIEINENALAACRSKKLSVTSADITSQEPMLDVTKKFDMIVLFEVLEHLDNPNIVFSNIDRILNDDGLLIIAVPNPDGYLKELDMVLLDMPPHHNTIWSQEAFSYISDKYHWPIIEYLTEPLRYVHYVSYLTSIANKIYFSEKSLKNKILSKLNSLTIYLLAPFQFTTDKQYLRGQTHMVVFQKKTG